MTPRDKWMKTASGKHRGFNVTNLSAVEDSSLLGCSAMSTAKEFNGGSQGSSLRVKQSPGTA